MNKHASTAPPQINKHTCVSFTEWVQYYVVVPVLVKFVFEAIYSWCRYYTFWQWVPVVYYSIAKAVMSHRGLTSSLFQFQTVTPCSCWGVTSATHCLSHTHCVGICKSQSYRLSRVCIVVMGVGMFVLGQGMTSLLLYEAYANESSQICPFLALRPEFHSNLRVILTTPRYCQSATFGRLTFCVYTFFNGIRV